ncbi:MULTISPECIES: hypothetical protein [unclassified Pseudomonas]|uniref:hypothetical protein n=1 Tax=unclassified Pseudomonas TaxID=196821 RepID=UPI001CBD607B|nr:MULTISPECIES: hypothetical protein [unclassified Pseudomonas]
MRSISFYPFLSDVSKSTYRVTEAATNAWNASYAGQPLANQAPIPIEVTQYPIENITNTIMPGNNTTHVGTVQAGGTSASSKRNHCA